jgi:flavin-dependent dehydrogenase
MTTWDVVVAGAGPAGSMAARTLARSGASVLLVERQAFPRWKVCGACLSRGAVGTLAAVGLGGVVRAAGGVPLERMELFAGRRRAALPLRGARVLSREALDAALVREAVAAGATFLSATRVDIVTVTPDARRMRLVGRERDEVVEARVVVEATGLGSPSEGDDVEVAAGSRVGLGAIVAGSSYDVGVGDLHMVVGRSGYVGLVRLEDGTLDVGAAVDPDALRALGPADAVAEIMQDVGRPALDGELVRGWRGTPSLTRRHARPGGERLFRVGDAAEYVEPFTGEGICWALAGGLAVAGPALEGVRAWDARLVQAWTTYQRRTSASARRLCSVLAWALRKPRLIAGGVAALAQVPALAGPLLRRAATPPRAYGERP